MPLLLPFTCHHRRLESAHQEEERRGPIPSCQPPTAMDRHRSRTTTQPPLDLGEPPLDLGMPLSDLGSFIGRKNGGPAPPHWLWSACHLAGSGCSHHRINAPSLDPWSPGRLSTASSPPAAFHQRSLSVARCRSQTHPLPSATA
ncbi:hypothetical protein COCNU_scaffold001264G000010 [Cocos nucifera]|nr:hypothetical protein [Cocos nucifera]